MKDTKKVKTEVKSAKDQTPPVNKNDHKTSVRSQELKKKLLISFYIIVAGLILMFGGYFWYSQTHINKIYPNIYIGDTNLGGLDKEQAINLLTEKTKNFTWNADVNYADDKEYHISSKDINLSYDIQKTYDKLIYIGRSGVFWDDLKTQLSLLFSRQKNFAIFELDRQIFEEKLKQIYDDIEKPVVDASFRYQDEKLIIVPESTGLGIDKDAFVQDIDYSIGSIQTNFSKELTLIELKPKISSDQLAEFESQYQAILSDTIILKSEVKNIEITKKEIFSYISLSAIAKNHQKSLSFFSSANAEDISYDVSLDINVQRIQQFLQSVKVDINKDTKNAKLSFSDGKVSVFQSPEKGYQLDEEETAKKIASLLLARMGVKGTSTDKMNSSAKELDMALKITEPDVSDTNIEKLGIKELVGTGTTSFAGSPSNRVFNITHGAEQFHGLLIKPGDTLSAIGIIGDPSAETGYLPELVIKGSTTIPEYGGGLCQVSTTLFRAALNAGMEIVERSNHAYRVSYYEPPVGMDATIYYPKPDFIFRNNTNHYILVQSYINGSNLTFEFYGTKDDRQVEISDPVILDTIPAPADKYVESKDLAAGEIKRKESSHPGAHASFHYKVTIDGKVVIDQDFLSYYTPWQALYYYGPGTSGIPGVADPAPAPAPAPEPAPAPAPTTSAPTPTPTPTPSPSTT